MFKSLLCLLLSSYCLQAPPAHAAGEFLHYEELNAVIAQLEQDGFYPPGELQTLFASVARDEGVLKAIARPAEGTREWRDYRPIFMSDDRVKKGLELSLIHI